ncbi:unnamed protein product [Amoebophrya sp. A25]|nr:unnamed protein product [Amoebophrya sp. A25]|eukprot:GSA25T00016940001.1
MKGLLLLSVLAWVLPSLAIGFRFGSTSTDEPFDTRNSCWRYYDKTHEVCVEHPGDLCRQHFCGPIFRATAANCGGKDDSDWGREWASLQARMKVVCGNEDPRHAGKDIEASTDEKYQDSHMLDKPFAPCEGS